MWGIMNQSGGKSQQQREGIGGDSATSRSGEKILHRASPSEKHEFTKVSNRPTGIEGKVDVKFLDGPIRVGTQPKDGKETLCSRQRKEKAQSSRRRLKGDTKVESQDFAKVCGEKGQQSKRCPKDRK